MIALYEFRAYTPLLIHDKDPELDPYNTSSSSPHPEGCKRNLGKGPTSDRFYGAD
jgi:hypothetical protein